MSSIVGGQGLAFRCPLGPLGYIWPQRPVEHAEHSGMYSANIFHAHLVTAAYLRLCNPLTVAAAK